MNAFDSKGDKPLKVCIFGHIKQYFPIDSIGGEYDIVFPDHKEVVVDIWEKPVIFNIIVEPVQDKSIRDVIIKVLSNKVSLLVLTDDMVSSRVYVNSGASLSREFVPDRVAIVWKWII